MRVRDFKCKRSCVSKQLPQANKHRPNPVLAPYITIQTSTDPTPCLLLTWRAQARTHRHRTGLCILRHVYVRCVETGGQDELLHAGKPTG